MKHRIILAAADRLGCCYYRLFLPYQELTKYGFDVLMITQLNNLELNPNKDVLVMQRQSNPLVANFAEQYKTIGGKIISEMDDYLHDLPPNNPARHAYPKGGEALKSLDKVLSLSDLLITSTQGLANAYSKQVKNIKICYNSVNSDYFVKPKKEFHKNGIINLGWCGSGTHKDDIDTIIKPITEILMEYPNVRFKFVGMDYSSLFPSYVKGQMSHVGHTFPVKDGKALFVAEDGSNPVHDYYDLIEKAEIDIALAPLMEVKFNHCKSYIKLLEYGIKMIPFVATGYGPYFDYVNKNRTGKKIGLLANKPNDWKKHIKSLIENKEMCQEIAENNYQNVMDNHLIQNNVHQWIKALSTIGINPSDEVGTYSENIIINQ